MKSNEVLYKYTREQKKRGENVNYVNHVKYVKYVLDAATWARSRVAML